MERNREARRMVNGGLSSSSSSSRRRQRTSSSSLRDSPEEDGGMELQETRLRERGKKERDRDRSGRSKRRRVDRGAMMLAMHGGGGREDGEDTSEDSAEDDEEDDYEDTVAPQQQQQNPPLRLPPPPPLPPGNPSVLQNQSSSSLNHHHHNHHHNQQQQQHQQQHQHQHHHQQQHRKGVVAAAPKASRVTGVWKAAADEMIGVSVPRKARTASAKRSPECWVSGSGSGREGGGGTGGGPVEAVHRQPSTSPARPSPSSSAPISPSSSNASIRKKLKPSRENKHRPPKISKPQSSVQDIEFEVAEVLYGMTRQFPGPPKQEPTHKCEPKEAPNGSGNNDAKSRVSSPNSISASSAPPQVQPPLLPLPPDAVATSGVVAPKRKRPRPIKPEEENPASPLNLAVPAPSILPPGKVEEEQNARADLPPVKPEKMPALADKMPGLVVENGVAAPEELHSPQEAAAPTDVQKEMVKMEVDKASESKPPEVEAEARGRVEVEVEGEPAKQVPVVEDVKQDEASENKVSPPTESSGKEKFEIDLMAPPPGKPPPEDEAMEEFGVDHKVMVPEETGKKVEKMEEERKDETAKLDRVGGSGLEPEAEVKEEMDPGKMPSKERIFELQLEIPKQDNKDEVSNSRQQQPQKQPPLQQQQSKPPRTDLKSEKSVQPGASSLQMNVPGWHGGLPPFGYMGQVPSLVPMDGGSAGPAKPVQAPHVLVPPQRPKRCATHCYIAQCIQYHQQLQQLSRYWPAAAGATAFFGPKPQYNVNSLQPTDSVAILGNTLQGGGFPARNISSLQDMGNPAVAAAFGGLAAKDKIPVAVNATLDSSQRKQLVLQQTPQGVSGNNMLTPAFVFPFNQQQAAAAAAAAAALNRPGAVAKSGGGATATAPLTSAPVGSSAVPASGAATVSFNYTNLPPGEPPYVAILQNNAYHFPIPAPPVGAPPQFRGSNAQAMPFFSGSFYPSQMLHPSQLQQQQPPSTQPQQSQQAMTAPSGQQGHQNKSTSSGSSSSQKHQQQRVHGSVSGTPPSHGFPRPQYLVQTGRPTEAETVSEDTPSSADSRVPSGHKGIYSHNFSVPVHPQNIALMPSTSEKQTHAPPSSQNSPSQAFTVSFPSLNGVTPPLGIDFSSASQNHALFQSIPEGARQGYQMAAAVAAASQAAHQKKSEGKPGAEPTEEERKAMLTTKSPVNFSQHSLAFASTSPSLSNSAVEGSSRAALNVIQQPPSNSSRSSNRPMSAAPSSAAAGVAAASFGQQQQHPHIVQQQLQRQQQQQIMLQQQLASRPKTASTATSTATLYTADRLVSTSAIPKLQNPLGGFPQAVVMPSGVAAAAAAGQANQWKTATRSSAQVPIPSHSQSTISSSIKNQTTQQQGRGAPQTSSLPNQTQISFSVATGVGNTQKLQQQSGQQLAGVNGTSNPSPQPTVSKGGGGSNGGGSGSPRSSTISKQGPPLSGNLPLQQQPQQSKSSPANSGHKSSPVSSGRTAPSILGQPHIALPPQGSSSKQQIEQMQHFQQAQLYFSGAYMNAPSSQAYFQRHQQQQQHSPSQQPSSTSTSAGVLSLCPPALSLGGTTVTTDPGKSVAVPNMKNMPPQNLLQAAQLAAAAQRPLMSTPGFPYVHAISSVSVKSVEQKPATGNDNLHACWQPEKR